MEYLANTDVGGASRYEIPVYRIFDKVCRCFQVTAEKQKIPLSISGSSIGAVDGPRVFDLVPYLLIDNAIKYSPTNRPVTISCNDVGNVAHCSVLSVGPLIGDSEKEAIFRYSVRGENAIKSQKSGSGYGLPVLKKIVEEMFHGEVTVSQQGQTIDINGVPYRETNFSLVLPIHNPTGLGVLR